LLQVLYFQQETAKMYFSAKRKSASLAPESIIPVTDFVSCQRQLRGAALPFHD
jgi:hypothetical protein